MQVNGTDKAFGRMATTKDTGPRLCGEPALSEPVGVSPDRYGESVSLPNPQSWNRYSDVTTRPVDCFKRLQLGPVAVGFVWV